MIVFLKRTKTIMFQVKVNNNEWDIELKGNSISVNGKPADIDISQIDNAQFHVLHQHRSYNVMLVDLNREEKTATLRVNGNDYNVSVKNNMDLLLLKLGMNNLSSNKINEIKAPMPGKVFDTQIQQGTVLKKGDTVLILEAMKMENVLKAPGDGIVKEVKIKKGDTVEKNQVLIIME
jgi:biotin carboxyl carrier protein